jgi:transposase
MGRSRGGLTTKIHAVTDARGLPIRFALTPGQVHDGQMAAELLGPLAEGCIVLADKAYDAEWIRDHIEQQGAAPNIPDKTNRKDRHCFSAVLHREPNRIERFFNRGQALPPHRHPLVEARRQLSRHAQARRHSNLATC